MHVFINVEAAHEKISHLVTSLSTSRQQVVFALLVTSCQQVWNKLLTICNNLVDIIRFVTRLFQQVRHSHDIAVLLPPCVVNLVTFLFIMTVSDLIVVNKLVPNLLQHKAFFNTMDWWGICPTDWAPSSAPPLEKKNDPYCPKAGAL